MKLTQECSTKWYRWRDWRYYDSKKKRYVYAEFRKLGGDGIAFGPIMLFWNWRNNA